MTGAERALRWAVALMAVAICGWTAQTVAAQEPDPAVTPVPTVAPEPVVAAEPAATVVAEPTPTAEPAPPEPAPPEREVVAAQTPEPTPTTTPTPTPTPTATPTATPTPTVNPSPPASEDFCVFERDASCQVLASQCTPPLGTPGPDHLVGGPAAELICGLGGDDTIEGGDGDDVLLGGDGNDTLIGGPGDDCMLGEEGDDVFPGEEEFDVVVGEGDETAEEIVNVDPQAPTCSVSVRGGGGVVPQEDSLGGVQGPVETGTVVLAIAQLVGDQSSAFPLTVADTATVQDGVARLLLTCPEAAVAGRLTLTTRRRRAGREPFECTPRLERVDVTLTAFARDALEDEGRLRVRVRIDLEGRDEPGFARVTLREEE